MVVQVIVIAHKNIWIPCHCHKDGVDAGAKRCREEIADLQTNEKGECNNDHSEISVRVVRRVSELKPQEGHQRSCKPNEDSTKGEDRSDQAVVDQRIDATVLDHSGDTS